MGRTRPHAAADARGVVGPDPRHVLALLAALPLLVALLLPFASLPPFQIGFWERGEPVIIAGHALAAVTALVMAVLCRRGWLDRPPPPAAAAFLALALWSMLAPTLAGMPVGGLLGTPQSGLGPLWFADLAVWLAAASLVRQHQHTWNRLCIAALLAALMLTGLVAWASWSGDIGLIPVTSYYGWVAMALAALPMGWSGPRSRIFAAACFLIALPLAAAAGSRVLLTVTLAVIALSAVALWRPHLTAGTLAPRFASLALAAMFALPVLLLLADVLGAFAPSMRAREDLADMVVAGLRDDPEALVAGRGWGAIHDVFVTHLTVVARNLWDSVGWDLLHRDYFHGHNVVIEALVSVGLPGLILLAWAYRRLLSAKSGRVTLPALTFVCLWLLALGYWMELLFVLPWFALAATGLSAPVAADRHRPRWGWAGAFLLVAVAQGFGAGFVLADARQADAVDAWVSDPRGEMPILPDLRRDARVAVPVLLYAERRLLDEIAERPPEQSLRIAEALLQRLDRLLETRENPSLPFIIAVLFERGLLGPPGKLTEPLRSRSALWDRAIDEGLRLAPLRPDLAIGRMTERHLAGDWPAVRRWADRLLAANPSDPVGLYFRGLVAIAEGRPAAGSHDLRASLAAGVTRFINLDQQVIRQIEASAPRD